jgi:hypothetical protein
VWPRGVGCSSPAQQTRALTLPLSLHTASQDVYHTIGIGLTSMKRLWRNKGFKRWCVLRRVPVFYSEQT